MYLILLVFLIRSPWVKKHFEHLKHKKHFDICTPCSRYKLVLKHLMFLWHAYIKHPVLSTCKHMRETKLFGDHGIRMINGALQMYTIISGISVSFRRFAGLYPT